MLVGTGKGHQAAGLYEQGQGGGKQEARLRTERTSGRRLSVPQGGGEVQPGLISAAPGPEHQQLPSWASTGGCVLWGATWVQPKAEDQKTSPQAPWVRCPWSSLF